MKRITMVAFVGVLAYAILAMGCLDRKPAPVCPVPTEIASNEQTASDFDGVDLLVVVDNSGSMAEEQNILSTGFYTLVNSLTRPLSPEVDPEWGFPSVNNMRVAIVTSDMGLQWGGGQTGGNTTDVQKCANDLGDNGEFKKPNYAEGGAVIDVASHQIKCENGGGQCPSDPDGWSCNAENTCEAPGNIGTVNCPGTREFAETTSKAVDADMTTEVACMGQQGTEGCGVEQQLEAAVRGLENHLDFMVASHLLAVLVVSDEEDCSIRDNGLFETENWMSGAANQLNVACNHPKESETFLFPANNDDAQEIAEEHNLDPSELSTYYNKFVNLKGGAAAVIFAAIVGVPVEGEDESPCQGDGNWLRDHDCLGAEEMELNVAQFTIEDREFTHFQPACVREDNGTEVTSARPGRRFVKTAMDFGANGYVYSICNEDWSPAMRSIAEIIARQITATCYDKQLDWELKDVDGCDNCGEAKCDVVVEYARQGADINDESCPDDLYTGLSDAEANRYKSRKTVDKIKENGVLQRKIINCPLPKKPTPLDCEEAAEMVDHRSVGWFYCEKRGENFNDACKDGQDNDDDNGNGIINDPDDLADCDDPDCQVCTVCGESGVECETGCRYGIEITDAGKNAATGQFIKVQCLQRFRFEDENCQEDSAYACQNGVDDDGNGVWDCVNTLEHPSDKKGAKAHLPDPFCCPIEMDENGDCKLTNDILNDILGVCVPKSKRENIRSFGDFWSAIRGENIVELDACRARIADLGCKVQN